MSVERFIAISSLVISLCGFGYAYGVLNEKVATQETRTTKIEAAQSNQDARLVEISTSLKVLIATLDFRFPAQQGPRLARR
jgi:Flp pilus assembly protein TadB